MEKVEKNAAEITDVKAPKEYFIVYPNKSFSGVSIGVAFKNGKSVTSISDESVLEKFKRSGYTVELKK